MKKKNRNYMFNSDEDENGNPLPDHQVRTDDGDIIDRYQECSLGCGGQEEWCNTCQTYTNNCCVPYGTCACA